MPNGTSIRNIKRNMSEMATGTRRNRYGNSSQRNNNPFNFKSVRTTMKDFFNKLFSMSDHLKHPNNRRQYERECNQELNALEDAEIRVSLEV